MVEWTIGHFEEVARIIKDWATDESNAIQAQKVEDITLVGIESENKEICNRFANSFRRQNPRFDTQRFLNACEVNKNDI